MNSFLLYGPLTPVQNSIKLNKNCDYRSADRQTDRQTDRKDANDFIVERGRTLKLICSAETC